MQSSPVRRYPSPVQRLWISDREVGAILGIHRSTVWRWLEQGLIPRPRRVGGRTLWAKADIELFAGCSSLVEFRRLRARQADA